jgi:hypothetical protein
MVPGVLLLPAVLTEDGATIVPFAVATSGTGTLTTIGTVGVIVPMHSLGPVLGKAPGITSIEPSTTKVIVKDIATQATSFATTPRSGRVLAGTFVAFKFAIVLIMTVGGTARQVMTAREQFLHRRKQVLRLAPGHVSRSGKGIVGPRTATTR